MAQKRHITCVFALAAVIASALTATSGVGLHNRPRAGAPVLNVIEDPAGFLELWDGADV